MFSERLRSLRRQSGLTQEQFSEKLHVSQGTIAMWETSKREPDINTIIKLSSFFNIDIDYLLGHTKEPIKPPDLINNDPELTEYLDQLANRSEMRMLFSLAKNATKADVETAVKIIEAIRGNGDVET